MQCPRCSHENSEERRYCEHCNFELPRESDARESTTQNSKSQDGTSSSKNGDSLLTSPPPRRKTHQTTPFFKTLVITLSALTTILVLLLAFVILNEMDVPWIKWVIPEVSQGPEGVQEDAFDIEEDSLMVLAPCWSGGSSIPPEGFTLTIGSSCKIRARLENLSSAQKYERSGKNPTFRDLPRGTYGLAVKCPDGEEFYDQIVVNNDVEYTGLGFSSIELNLETQNKQDANAYEAYLRNVTRNRIRSHSVLLSREDHLGLFDCIPIWEFSSNEYRVYLYLNGVPLDSADVSFTSAQTKSITFVAPGDLPSEEEEDENGDSSGATVEQYEFRLDCDVPLSRAEVTFEGQPITADASGIWKVDEQEGLLEIELADYIPFKKQIDLVKGQTVTIPVDLEHYTGIRVKFQRYYSTNAKFTWNNQRVADNKVKWNNSKQTAFLDLKGSGNLLIAQTGLLAVKKICTVPDETIIEVSYRPCRDYVEVGFRTGEQRDCPSLWRTTVTLDFPCDECDTTFTVLDDFLNIMLCAEEAVVHLHKEGRDSTIPSWDFASGEYFSFRWPPCEQSLTIEFPNLQFSQSERNHVVFEINQTTQSAIWLSDNKVKLSDLPVSSGVLDLNLDQQGWPVQRRLSYNIDISQYHSLSEFHRTAFSTSRQIELKMLNPSTGNWLNFNNFHQGVTLITKKEQFFIELLDGGQSLLVSQFAETQNNRINIILCPTESYNLIEEATKLHWQIKTQLDAVQDENPSSDFRESIQDLIQEARHKLDQANSKCDGGCNDCPALNIMLSYLSWRVKPEQDRFSSSEITLSRVTRDHEEITSARPVLVFGGFNGALGLLHGIAEYIEHEDALTALMELANDLYQQTAEYYDLRQSISQVEASYLWDARLAYIFCMKDLYKKGVISKSECCELLKKFNWHGEWGIRDELRVECNCDG